MGVEHSLLWRSTGEGVALVTMNYAVGVGGLKRAKWLLHSLVKARIKLVHKKSNMVNVSS